MSTNTKELFDRYRHENIDKLMSFMSIHDITIVSYGLAPNSFGFCYEAGEGTSASASEIMDDWLDALTELEVLELRRRVFE